VAALPTGASSRIGVTRFRGHAPRWPAVELRSWMLEDHAGLADRFDQSIVAHVPRGHWRQPADGAGSTIAFLLLHTALHEDLAVTTAVRGEPPRRAAWQGDLGLDRFPPHAALSETEDRAVTEALDLEALDAFARAVHDDVHSWLAAVDLRQLDETPPAPVRIDDLAGVRADAVPWLHTMWAGKSVDWFVRWESIGHRQGHLGEMISIRNRHGLSPF
jgi:hypothetical protein